MNFDPVVARPDAKPSRILAERLVKDANDDNLASGPRRRFRELLEEIDVVAHPQRGSFEKLAHLIDDNQDAVVLLGLGGFANVRDEGRRVSLASIMAKPLRLAKTFGELGYDTRSFADDRDGQPTLAIGQSLIK